MTDDIPNYHCKPDVKILDHDSDFERYMKNISQLTVETSHLPNKLITFNPSDPKSIDSLLSKHGPEGLYEISKVLRKAADYDMEVI